MSCDSHIYLWDVKRDKKCNTISNLNTLLSLFNTCTHMQKYSFNELHSDWSLTALYIDCFGNLKGNRVHPSVNNDRFIIFKLSSLFVSKFNPLIPWTLVFSRKRIMMKATKAVEEEKSGLLIILI